MRVGKISLLGAILSTVSMVINISLARIAWSDATRDTIIILREIEGWLELLFPNSIFVLFFDLFSEHSNTPSLHIMLFYFLFIIPLACLTGRAIESVLAKGKRVAAWAAYAVISVAAWFAVHFSFIKIVWFGA